MPSRPPSPLLAPLCIAVLLTLAAGAAGLQLLGAGTRLVATQGRWSAAERDAAAALERYARSGDEHAWTTFRRSVTGHAVPSSGLAHLPLFAPAFMAWSQAEAELLELRTLGDRLREVGAVEAARAIPQIRSQHELLVRLDENVARELGAAVERLRLLVLATLVLACAALLLLGRDAARRLTRRQAVLARALRQQQHEATCEHLHAHVALRSIGDAVITTDASGCIEYMNAAAELLTGWKLEEARGRPACDICDLHLGDDGLASHGDGGQRSGTLLRRDGSSLIVHEHAAPLTDASGAITGTVRVLRDVTRERAFARELEHQATHDGLTGLVNRNEFERQLAALLPVAEGEAPHALLYFDLDQFKTINDTCGHSAGDALLRRFAQQVQSRLRASDTLARLGGDEFCALLRSCPLPQALELAEGIRQHVAEVRFPWQGHSFAVSASIGVVSVDSGIADVAEALGAADQACYQSKEAGRNRVRLWRPDDRLQHARQSELHWLARLNEAFENGGFCLLAQRLHPLAATGGMHMMEVLVRMRDERGQMVAPMAFIPAAERYGMTGRLDRWVISHTIGLVAAHDASVCALINLSAASLADHELAAFIRGELARHGLPPERLGFEISETLAITQLHRATRLMRELKTMGCRTALDDFGGGLSSVVYLRDLAVDYLKIDGNLVCDMTRDPVMYAMVEAVQHVARVLGLRTIAEWAEEPAHVDALTVIGADHVQGYAIHRPEPIEDCLDALPAPMLREMPALNAARARNSGPLRVVP